MERKRVKYKGPVLDWNNKENIISKKTYIFLANQREINSDREVQTYEKENLQQSCIFDPSFTVDSSTSNSGESSSSNEWLNCEDEIYEEMENSESNGDTDKQERVLASKTACSDEPPGSTNLLPSYKKIESKDSILSKYASEDLNQTNKSPITSEKTACHVKNPSGNKVQFYKSRSEPYFEEKLLKGNPQTLLSNISKLYIGGYGEVTSIAGYVSESESSVHSEDSTKRAIKSILKREPSNQIGDNPKKKVRFDLNLRSFEGINNTVSQFPTDKNAKAVDTKLNDEIKAEAKSTEFRSNYQCSENITKENIVETNLEVYTEQCHCQSYFTNKEGCPKIEHDDKIIKTPITINRECEKISFNSLATDESLEESLNMQTLRSGLTKRQETEKDINDKISSPKSKEINTPLKDSMSFTSIGVQADQLKTDSESVTCSIQTSVSSPLSSDEGGPRIDPTELKKTHTGTQPLFTENEYSSFIKDLVSGSGDKLAKFLISLSSEISSKSGGEKIANALMTVGFVQEKKESFDLFNKMQKKSLSGNVKMTGYNADLNNREKDIESVKKITKCSNKKNERNLLINNRKSMSEINIHQLKGKEPYYNSYKEKRFHSSRVDQLFIKKTNDDCMWHNLPNNNPNANSEVMGRLYEIIKELKQNVDKICRKESTIRIENAQIWLKENKQFESFMSAGGSKNGIVSDRTKETYAQTIETIDVHLEDHVQRQAVGKTEILIVSNSKNEEINIKVNDKSTKKHFMIDPTEPNKTNDDLNEIEERKRFFQENKHIPFNVVFNDRTHLPTLKKGKYEVEIFEKMEGQTMHDTQFKSFMKKLTGNFNSMKLNGVNSYEKSPNLEKSSFSSSKLKDSQNHKENKPLPNMVTNFINRLLKLKINPQDKNLNRQFVNSQHWSSTDQLRVLKSLLPNGNKEKSSNPTNDVITGSEDIEPFKPGNIPSSCAQCDKKRIEGNDGDYWPDVIKTKYPNGMIHFGPLTVMPEPTAVGYEKQCMELESCSCPKHGGCHRYVYNKHMKHMVKASMSRNMGCKPDGKLSLEEFSETEQEFYHQWSEMGKV